MRSMRRYMVPVTDRAHAIPLTSSPVKVAAQSPGVVEFWAEHDSDVPEQTCAFRVFGIGQSIPPQARYIGTCERIAGLVWHLYQLMESGVTNA